MGPHEKIARIGRTEQTIAVSNGIYNGVAEMGLSKGTACRALVIET